MKFGQLFISVNILMDHQAFGALLKVPYKIANSAGPNGLASQTNFGSSRVGFSLADEQLSRKMISAEQMRLQAKNDCEHDPATTSHVILEQGVEKQVMDTHPLRRFLVVEAPKVSPDRYASKPDDNNKHPLPKWAIISMATVGAALAGCGGGLVLNALINCYSKSKKTSNPESSPPNEESPPTNEGSPSTNEEVHILNE